MGCFDTLAPLPQANSDVVKIIQIHFGKLKQFSAIDFNGFCFLSNLAMCKGIFKKAFF